MWKQSIKGKAAFYRLVEELFSLAVNVGVDVRLLSKGNILRKQNKKNLAKQRKLQEIWLEFQKDFDLNPYEALVQIKEAVRPSPKLAEVALDNAVAVDEDDYLTDEDEGIQNYFFLIIYNHIYNLCYN